MQLQSDDFELLGLPRQFAQDPDVLTAQWKALQRQVHPDRFANGTQAEKRLAMQWSARINEAYRRLLQPLSRATYLCELAGHPIGAEDNTAMPRQFLMQQMQWLEALDDAEDEAAIAPIEQEVMQALAATIEATAAALDRDHDYPAAVSHVRAWMFLERFMQRVKARRQQLSAGH